MFANEVWVECSSPASHLTVELCLVKHRLSVGAVSTIVVHRAGSHLEAMRCKCRRSVTQYPLIVFFSWQEYEGETTHHHMCPGFCTTSTVVSLCIYDGYKTAVRHEQCVYPICSEVLGKKH